MSRLLSFLFLLLFALINAYAYEVTATVVTADDEPVAYATYRIFLDDSVKPLISNTSSVDGVISQQLSRPGAYTMTLSYVGMADTTCTFEVSAAMPVADLGKIVINEASEMLSDVTVTAQRPLVIKDVDRIGYDVESDPEAPSSTVQDILRKVPMVSVDADGTIKVNGSTNFKIYKNGRPNNSMGRNAKELFAALPATMIKKIEVITEPGAEYDAEGTSAILNIVTTDSRTVKGLMGTASLNYTTGYAPMPFLWLTSQVDKVTASAQGGYFHLDGPGTKMRSNNENTYLDSGNSRRESVDGRYKADGGFFGVDVSYEMDSLNLFTAELSGYTHNVMPYTDQLSQMYDPAGMLIGSYRQHSDTHTDRYFDVNANINYQRSTRHKGETFTLSYLLSTTNQKSDKTDTFSDFEGVDSRPYTGILSKYDLNFIEHTFQGDWKRPIGPHTLNAGLKWIIRRNHSTNAFDYVDWQTMESDFRHVTNIGAAYAQYGYRIGPVNLRAGLRYEYSHLKATYPDGSQAPFSTNLNDLVPSASVMWQMSDPSTLTFNYATSISRPGIEYLNPAEQVSVNSVSFGNSHLESARRQSLKLTWMFIKSKFNINLSANYTFINNGIASVQYVTDGDILNSTYANTGKSRTLSLSTFLQWSITSKTNFMVNGQAMYQNNRQSGMSLSRWTPMYFMRLSQELPWKLQGEIGHYFWGGNINGVYSYSSIRFSQNAGMRISLRRSFLKEDRLSVRLSVSNPFGRDPRCFETYTVNGGYRGISRSYHFGATRFDIQINYRFGSLNARVKKTAASIENDDLVGRKTGGDAKVSQEN